MKKISFIIIAAFLFTSCALTKSYYLIGDDNDVNINDKKCEKIDLKNYDVYKREIFFKNDGINLYKGYNHPDSTYKRYEVQFFLVEKEDKKEKKIIYFSYIPPYKVNNVDNYLTQIVFNENDNLVNIHLINYIYFGKLFFDEIVQINKVKSLSNWNISFKKDKTEIFVNSITFLDRGKIKTRNTSSDLGNIPTYKKIDNPNIVLHQELDESISDTFTDKISDNIIYYDLEKKCVYIKFKDFLEYKDEKQINKWIKFGSDRVKGVYEK